MADEWELRRQEVEVMIKKPLGQGAFGAVYRGTLQPQIMGNYLIVRKHMKEIVISLSTA